MTMHEACGFRGRMRLAAHTLRRLLRTNVGTELVVNIRRKQTAHGYYGGTNLSWIFVTCTVKLLPPVSRHCGTPERGEVFLNRVTHGSAGGFLRRKASVLR